MCKGHSVMADEELLDPNEAFAEISRIKLSDTNLDGVLNHLARLAKRTIAGAAEVSVTLSRGAGAYTAAFSGDLALLLDETQYEQATGRAWPPSGPATPCPSPI